MPRVGEFCAANVSRLLLGVAAVVLAVVAVGCWLFYSPGKGHLIQNRPSQPSAPALAK